LATDDDLPPLARTGGADADPLVGTVFAERYRVLGRLARGSTAWVYRAEDGGSGRIVALKVLDPAEPGDPDPAGGAAAHARRFDREAAVGARLTHPHTVRLLGSGRTAAGTRYLVLDHVPGRTLLEVLQTDAPMDAARVVGLGCAVAGALAELHGLGLVHRDVKPTNILLWRSDAGAEVAKLLDFGLVTTAGAPPDPAPAGAPRYMSPEQLSPAPLDARTDVYALGAVLYACLTGRAPFDGPGIGAIVRAHLSEPPPPMSVVCPSMRPVPGLEAVVRRCLLKRPADRFPSMGALADALAAATIRSPAPPRADAPPRAAHASPLPGTPPGSRHDNEEG
jgi:serine/threonine-protein kinase